MWRNAVGWRSRGVRIGATAVVLLLAAVLAWQPALRALGALMAAPDPSSRADYVIVTPESGQSGELEAALLFEAGVVSTIVVLMPEPGAVDRELRRRGVAVPNEPTARLGRLGIPRDRIAIMPAAEGGTTDSASAIALWFERHSTGDGIVITSATHIRRFRRTLGRYWRLPGGLPAVHSSRFDGFRAKDWWLRRRTLREGIVELQKLALDYVAHPF